MKKEEENKSTGWWASPFNPNREEPEFMIYQEIVDSLIKNIKKHENSIFWLKAPAGSGKTTVFKWIEKNQQHNIRPIYIDMRTITDTPEINKIIREESLARGWERFLRGRKPTKKHVLLMVDECDLVVDQKKFGAIIGWTAHLPHSSVIFASVEGIPHDVSTRAFRTRHVDRITLEKPSFDVILDSIKKRIQHVGGDGYSPFTEDEIRAVIATHPTIRDILIDLEERCEGKTPTPEIFKEEEKRVKPATMFTKADFSSLTPAQRKVFDVLCEQDALTIKEIVNKTGIQRGSLAKHLQRLSNPGYCIETKKLPGRVLTRNADGMYRLSDEITAYILPGGKPESDVVKKVKKTGTEPVVEEEMIAPVLKEEKMLGEDVVEQILMGHKAFDTQTAIPKKTLIDMLSQEMKCDKNEAENTFIQLWNRGRLVYLDDKEKVFSVFGYKKK